MAWDCILEVLGGGGWGGWKAGQGRKGAQDHAMALCQCVLVVASKRVDLTS